MFLLTYRSNNWSLLPVHGIMSTVRPAFFMHGTPIESKGWGAYSFPSWLGQNSKTGKHSRVVKELSTKMRMRVSADSSQVRQTYIPTLAVLLSRPLVQDGKDGIKKVIDLMDGYFLNREDWDGILDVTIGNLGREKICTGMDSKVKSTFTST
jgi:replication factor C subunit 1